MISTPRTLPPTPPSSSLPFASPAHLNDVLKEKWIKEEIDLLNAAKQGNFVAVKRLLRENPTININAYDETHSTPLLLAIGRSHVECVEVLLAYESEGKRSVDVNHVDHNGSNSLLVAVQVGSLEMVNMLLAHPYLYLNQQNTTTGTTPIIEATRKDYLSIVNRLLRFHREIEIYNNESNTSAFLDEKYILGERESSLNIREEYTVDLNKVDLHGNNALFYANFNIKQGKPFAKQIKAELYKAPYKSRKLGCTCVIS